MREREKEATISQKILKMNIGDAAWPVESDVDSRVGLSLMLPYLDCGVESHPVLLLETGPDVQHVQLAPRHHYPHQGAVIGSSALSRGARSAPASCERSLKSVAVTHAAAFVFPRALCRF